MLTGYVPFRAEQEYDTFQLIIKREMVFPDSMSLEAQDLIDKILQLNPEQRLGCGPPGSHNDFNSIK
jgi:3-phosphoinositide dependent protein kinase-1